jgi:response regulator RpfG family c-di-GMP phosphodiesterase
VARKKIIIVDDEPDVRAVLKMSLREKYSVTDVGSGEECIRKYNEMAERGESFDMVITDYRMPGMHGEEVVRAVKEIDRETRAIVISAFDENESIAYLRKKGVVDAYMRKPVGMRELKNKVDEILYGE